jgi:HEAT repeat protein
MGEPAVGPLVTMLESEDAIARRNAAEMLGWIGSPSAGQALVAALADECAEVRSQAAWALDEMGNGVVQEAQSEI